MTRQEFDALVRRIEARYAGRPRALERATAAWVSLGMIGFASWLGLLFLLGAASFAAGMVLDPPGSLALVGLGVVLLVYGVTQAGLFLLVELAPAEGRLLRPGEAPQLVAVLDELRRELRCRPFNEVRISNDFNAGVREIPRLGLLGWPRTVLEIGLPLMLALSPEELRVVLAHEFVHLSARHGRSGTRIHRLHRTWGNMIEQMKRPISGGVDRSIRWAVSRFVDWYWPRLHARSLALSRVHEFHADRVAASISGSQTLASSLWRMECLNPWLSERFWPDLMQEADRRAEPPDDVLDRLRIGFGTPPPPDDAARWTARGLSRSTVNEATHPALADRVRALGLELEAIEAFGFPTAAEPSSAAAYLGDDLAQIERELAAEWRRGASAAWRERHRRALAEAKRRGAAVEAAAEPESDPGRLWQRARDAVQLQNRDEAESLLRALLARDPEHAGARVLLGDHLMGKGDPEGERLLLEVAEQPDEVWRPRACESLQEHYRAAGQVDRVREMRARLDRHEAEGEAAQRERAGIGPRDNFLPHELAEAQVIRVRERLAALPDCAAAWLARKALRHFPQRPLYVLCVRSKASRWSPSAGERDQALVKGLFSRVELPGQVLVIAPRGSFRRPAARVMAVPGARVYPPGTDAVAAPAPS